MARINAMVAIGTAAVAVVACSSGKSAAPQRSTPPPRAQVTAQAAVASASAPRQSPPANSGSVAAAGLSGTWNGHYNGSYSGTFTLDWTRSDSDLSGTITLSSPGGSLPIHGTVSNGRISFGTVGSTAITYTGSVSGSAMSGKYEVAGGAGGTGTWDAARK